MAATVRIAPEAQREFLALPSRIRTRVTDVFERLAGWPDVSGAKPLRGDLAGHYRIRTGDYRVVFRVDGNKIMIVRIAHRKEVYDD